MDKETILVSLHHFNEKYSGTGFELAALFGSFARGTQDLYSDIDIHDLFYKDDAFAKLNKIQEIKKNWKKNYIKKLISSHSIQLTNKFKKHSKMRQLLYENMSNTL